MPEKVTDFVLEYDPGNPVLRPKKQAVTDKLMNASPVAFTWFQRNSNAPVSLRKSGHGEIQVLFGVANLLSEIPPAQAEYKAFSRSADLGFYRTDASKQLIPSDPSDGLASTGFRPINISEYYQGKQRRATNGQFEFQCTITIPEAVWKDVESRGAGIGIEQIRGILQQDPILITQKSKQTGVRCIKPEPYGWIFSTSVTTRLVATNVSPQTNNPAALVFNEIESGH
jgi:hypothetical protein